MKTQMWVQLYSFLEDTFLDYGNVLGIGLGLN